jgi:MYXO-CTERM domain-containing protein
MKRSLSLLRVGLAAGALMIPAIAQTASDPNQAQPGAGAPPATRSDTTTPGTGTGDYGNRGDDRGRGFNFGWLGLVGLAGLLGLRRHSNPTITTRTDRNIEPR